jgi:hypothetical protein
MYICFMKFNYFNLLSINTYKMLAHQNIEYTTDDPPHISLALIGVVAGLAVIVFALNVWYFKYHKVCLHAFAAQLIWHDTFD